MTSCVRTPTIGLLLSGGLDSAILLGHLLEQGERVQPFYVRSGLCWQEAELAAVNEFAAAMARPALRPLKTIELPLADVYGGHWCVTGEHVPDADSPDEAVFLPGRNVLLVIKAALWCQLNQVPVLALGTLGSNPFADATPAFFDDVETALNRGVGSRLKIVRPFERLDKRQVMELGRGYPLGLTFSCIAPRGQQHCGRCNKCAERQAAFAMLGPEDPTRYAQPAAARRYDQLAS
ncbi:MAG TPA: 7-cyano-7-deazaguanine synthase [Pirellulales bacterium]|jgi:7-cyano-7-deazaguanine synthase|nr:7-cyano-7-deazaguanine synthase [Pirellulales bacterium]